MRSNLNISLVLLPQILLLLCIRYFPISEYFFNFASVNFSFVVQPELFYIWIFLLFCICKYFFCYASSTFHYLIISLLICSAMIQYMNMSLFWNRHSQLLNQTELLYFYVFTVSPHPTDRNWLSILIFYQSPILRAIPSHTTPQPIILNFRFYFLLHHSLQKTRAQPPKKKGLKSKRFKIYLMFKLWLKVNMLNEVAKGTVNWFIVNGGCGRKTIWQDGLLIDHFPKQIHRE